MGGLHVAEGCGESEVVLRKGLGLIAKDLPRPLDSKHGARSQARRPARAGRRGRSGRAAGRNARGRRGGPGRGGSARGGSGPSTCRQAGWPASPSLVWGKEQLLKNKTLRCRGLRYLLRQGIDKGSGDFRSAPLGP